jgi:ribonuclease HI
MRTLLPNITEAASMGDRKRVIIYTDGACISNPGPGGWAAVLICGDLRRELCGGFRRTTNNRMELLAAIEALKALKVECDVEVISDSRYVVDGGNDLMRAWRANADLWRQLAPLCRRHRVQFVWVRGHSGDAENERCDRLSEAAARAAELAVDEGYENPPREPGLFD